MTTLTERRSGTFTPSGPTLLEFISTMWSIPSVQRVGYRTTQVPPSLQLWVLFSHDVAEDFDQAAMAVHSLHQDPDNCLVYVNLFSLDQVREEVLPSITTIFSR